MSTAVARRLLTGATIAALVLSVLAASCGNLAPATSAAPAPAIGQHR